ncbi:hypothetical protein PIB30_079841 [Stylosanthes scabra]|uniref:Uncharacterized protein n=1 Tax=Stylosanthes scabra TaxID=79078 RepID=A0ABU6UQM9_9FABA|nr:hypothetical protein [Stylosanthes scabra]
MMQDTTSPPAQVPPPAANTLPAQPSQNMKSGINALQHEKKKKGRNVSDGEKRSYNLWYDLIAQLVDSDDEESEVKSEGEYSDESGEDGVERKEENEEDSDEDNGEESEDEEENGDWLYDLLVKLYEAQKREKESGDSQSEEESDVEDEIEEVETEDQHDKPFFIATLFNNKRVKEEIPAKCEDPGSCLVTCKIKHAVVRECLCDPRACSTCKIIMISPSSLLPSSKTMPSRTQHELDEHSSRTLKNIITPSPNQHHLHHYSPHLKPLINIFPSSTSSSSSYSKDIPLWLLAEPLSLFPSRSLILIKGNEALFTSLHTRNPNALHDSCFLVFQNKNDSLNVQVHGCLESSSKS